MSLQPMSPGPDPGACPRCGEWRKAGMIHRCPAATPDQNWADEDAVLAAVADDLQPALDEYAEARAAATPDPPDEEATDG